MIGKKINQLATELAPVSTDLTIIGDPISGVSKKITLAQLGAIFSGAVSFYTNLAGFPATGDINVIYCAKDTQKLYLWSGSAYVEVFPSQALLDTYQLRSEKGVSNGYASLDSTGKVPISQLPSSIMEYKGTWNAATNTPTLANGTGDTGDVYICNVAGTVNFGAGAITFAVGDYVIYSGTIWQRSSGAVGTVTSVGITESGDALTITGSPITTSGTINIGFAGTGAQYIKGDGTLATFPSTIAQAERLITEVYNSTGATLTKGTIVYINGGQGNLPTVTKALATGDSTSAQTFGVVQADITNNNNGYVVVAGKISDLDTQAYTEGTQLYLSSTTAGTWTSTKQYAPAHLVYVGIVVRAHPTQGVVEVKIQNGYEMDELHNVAAQNPDNNDILQYKTATSLWTKVAGTTSNIAEGSNLYYTDARSRAAISLTTTGTSGAATYNSTTGVLNVPQYAPDLSGYVPTSRTLTINGTTFDLSANRSWSVGTVTSVGLSSATSGVTIGSSPITTSGTITLAIATASGSQQGLLSSTDWTTFNNKQSALTNPVTGTGTTNYLPKFTGTSTIGDSFISVDSTNVTINGSAATTKLKIISPLSSSLFQSGIEFIRTTVSGGSKIEAIRDASIGGVGLSFQVTANNTAEVNATYTQAMVLNNSGNLGLGVTPSAGLATANYRLFEIGLDGGGSIYSGSNQTLIGTNISWNGGTPNYVRTGSAPALYNQANGIHSWSTAPSGTAGNAISFTQAMTLNASGNLSIGNTNDTYKLDVSGTGRFTGQLNGNLGVNVGANALGADRMFQVSGTAFTSGTTQFGVVVNPSFSGTITNVFGVYAGNNFGTGTITNSYNLYIEGTSLGSATVTNRWGLYQAGGSDKNYFAGSVGIGTTSPTALLHLSSGVPYIYLDDTSTSGTRNRFQILNGDVGTTQTVTFGFNNTSGTNLQEVIAFNENGRVGIGTTSPTATLHVNGTIKTGAPSVGSAETWKLGSYSAGGTGTATGVIYIEVNGQIYSIPALLGTP